MNQPAGDRHESARHYLDILRRRKSLVLVVPVLAVAAAIGISETQAPLYRATTEVLVKRTNIVSNVTNTQDPAMGDATRFLNTRSSIARSRDLAGRVAAASGIAGMTAEKVLSSSNVNVKADADVLEIDVENREPGAAVRLANVYGRELAQYQTELDTTTIKDAVALLNKRAKLLRARGAADSAAYASLIQYLGQLETLGTLLSNDTKVLQPAERADKVRPRPKRNAVLGAIFGAGVGIALAFLWEALDRRVRAEQEVEDLLGIPLLGRVPTPPRRLRKRHEPVMLADARSPDAETFSKLRTSVEFVNRDGFKTLMITSSQQREGKSTTAVNLAVAFARAGRRVALVDLDLRRPVQHSFFRGPSAPGIADVVVKKADIETVMRRIAVSQSHDSTRATRNGKSPKSTNGNARVEAVIDFLAAGTLPPSPSDFLQDERVPALLEQLADEHDLVLVDAPPLNAFGDVMVLSAYVDAIVPVVRMNVVERPGLRELARQLHNCRASALGFVATGVSRGDIYRYGYAAYAYDAPRVRERDSERA